MNTAKRALVKRVIVGTLAGGAVGMPLLGSAQAEQNNEVFNNCHGVAISNFVAPVGKNAALSPFDVRQVQQIIRLVCDSQQQ